uniref:Non-specific serine/threonine protein kinase n=1 Tax=Strongyloides venezuelensis TaxID=75913 RepID=A0A0K0EUW8_STRVS
MAEKPSDTSDNQRLKQMFCHLTPKKAVIPYTMAIDDENNMWVASKGGLFKISPDGKEVLWSKENAFPKKMSAYTQVEYYDSKIYHIQNEDKTGLSEFKIYSKEGEELHDSFIDGRVQSLVINSRGEMFMTKQAENGQDEFFIYTTTTDKPTKWDELVVLDEKAFQTLCLYDDDTLVVSTVNVPINMYSKEWLRFVDIKEKKLSAPFSSHGKSEGQIYFPRAIKKYEDDFIVLDKTGKFQRFNREGKYLETSATIDAYLANGFEIIGDQALIICSGIVYDNTQETICDDWLEKITLDGSSWKSERLRDQ